MAAPSPDEMSVALFIVKYGNYFWTGMVAFLGFIFLVKKGKQVEIKKEIISAKQIRHEMKICALELERKQDAKYFRALDKMKADILREIKLINEAGKP